MRRRYREFDQLRRHLMRGGLVPTCMYPSKISAATRGEKHGQARKMRLRKGTNLSIAFDQSVTRFSVHTIATDEVQRCGELEQVPPESGVIKVDYLQTGAVDENIFGNEVGMDEAVALGRCAEIMQVAEECLFEANEHLPLGR